MPGDALLVYRELARRWPTAEAGLDAFERGERLRRATGAAPDPPLDLVQRGERLRDGYRCEPGLAAFELALAADALEDELRARAERGRADCLFQRRRYAEAETAYAALARRRPGDLSPAIERARARGRLGETLAAADELRALARRARGAERARIEYLEAVMVRELDPARYRKAMTRVAAQSDSPGDAESARWNLAWDEVQAGRWAEAEQRLEPMARGDAADVEVQRARYWLARVREQRAPEQGRAELDALAANVPLSYYGLSAARRLGRAPALERPVLGARASAGGDRAIRRARWLVEGGFPDPAQDEIESRVRQGGLGREERVEAADLLHGAGNPFRAVSVVLDGFGASLEQGVDPAWRDVWRLAWPRPFTETVQSATAEFGFEPELVWAVMREESTYRPAIESPVGARGLMQIMPPTGERIANALGVAGFEAGSLYEPAVNVRFGTYYLNDLLAQFGGSRPLAIAAYNAGPEAVSRWIAPEPPVEEDRFVESVPYGETRRYVRKVLRSYQVYGLLYGASPAPAAPPDAQPGAGSGR
jgi:soluble lytic murein transglycosylase